MTLEEVVSKGHVVYAYELVIVVVKDHFMIGYRYMPEDGHWVNWCRWDWTDQMPRSLLSGNPADDSVADG